MTAPDDPSPADGSPSTDAPAPTAERFPADDPVPTDDLDKANAVLAEWAARSAADSDTLIERFEAMGYDLAGKSTEGIAETLRHPPTRRPRATEG